MFRIVVHRVIVVFSAIFIVITNSVVAEESYYSPDYPGLKENGGAVAVANSQVRDGIVAFQRVFGRNPQSWREVVDSGLFDNTLLGYRMENIDPDDASIDFKGDLYIDTETLSEFGADVLLFSFWQRTTNDIGRQKMEVGDTYSDILAASAEAMSFEQPQLDIIDAWLNDESQLIQFGHVYQLFNTVQVFLEVYGRLPDSLNELVSSGLGPLRVGSINPVTGQPYKFDGSKGDLLYYVTPDGRGFSLVHVDLNYEPGFYFPY